MRTSPRGLDLAVAPTNHTVAHVVSLLEETHKWSNLGNKRNPLDELLYVIISGQTSEQKYQVAFRAFKRAFPRWELVLKASVRKIRRPLRPAGLGHQKAGYLKSIAAKLNADFGKVSLRALKKMGTEQAEAYLLSLPGVGTKTARCVLMYSLDRAVFPADVHCLRIMGRLRWIDARMKNTKTISQAAQRCVPLHLRRTLHVRLVQHGRTTCRPIPQCNACILCDLCPTGIREKGGP